MRDGRYGVFLIDDHRIVRDGLRVYIEASRELHCVGESPGQPIDYDDVRRASPDMIVLDLVLTNAYPTGLRAIASLRELLPDVKVVVFSGFSEYFADAILQGAAGVIDKKEDPAVVVKRLVDVARGEFAPGSDVSADLIAAVGLKLDPDCVRRVATLTDREFEVAAEMAKGNDNARIAAHLGIASNGVKKHVNVIFSKLEVTDRVNAVLVALRGGILRQER